MAKYKLNSEVSSVTDTESGMSIPLVGGNRHYAEFVAWIDDGNTPDISWSVSEFINSKKAEIKEKFESAAQAGIIVSSGRKYDSKIEDYIMLRGALDLAKALDYKTIKVRDYNNKLHTITPQELEKDIIEIVITFKTGLEAKWDSQDAADNSGYSQFAQGELAKLMTIIEGNR